MNKFTTRILIVEDDPQIRNFISYVLSAEGFASDNAATGAERDDAAGGECL